jgi:hypothetical protein
LQSRLNNFSSRDYVSAYQPAIPDIALRNLPVLTKPAAKIASRSGNRETRRARKKMIQWLFFNRVNVAGDNLTINMGIKYPLIVVPHPAKTKVSFAYPATVAAQMTTHLTVFYLFVEKRFLHIAPICVASLKHLL